MVLDAAVIEDVAAYLRPPLDLLLPCLDLGLRPTATLQLLVVELRAQQAQRVLSIVRLAARLGILDDQLLLDTRLGVGIAVAQAYAGLDLIDILPPCATGAEGVPAHQGGIDLHLDAVIDQRHDEDGGKAGHTLALRIVGRDTHQSVYARLTLEEAVGLIALDLHGHGLDACLIAVLPVGDGRLVALPIAPAAVHACQHRGPVLALGTARPRIDLEHCPKAVLLRAEHILQLDLLEERHGRCVGRIDLLLGGDLLSVVL